MENFSQWLSNTGLSHFILNNEKWAVPTFQTIHIVGIGIIVGSTFAIALRILGLASKDQTLREVQKRFAPWVIVALCLIVPTGLLLIVGEPKRNLLAFSFWSKMTLLAAFLIISFGYNGSLKKAEDRWETVLAKRASVRALATITFLLLFGIIVMGRLIAYDHVWHDLFPALKPAAA